MISSSLRIQYIYIIKQKHIYIYIYIYYNIFYNIYIYIYIFFWLEGRHVWGAHLWHIVSWKDKSKVELSSIKPFSWRKSHAIHPSSLFISTHLWDLKQPRRSLWVMQLYRSATKMDCEAWCRREDWRCGDECEETLAGLLDWIPWLETPNL